MTATPTPVELDALVRLLDDDTPEVRSRVAERLSLASGDLSEWLASRPTRLSPRELTVLSRLLGPARRRALAREWVVPSDGARGLREDWETFEALLRALSDFMHDGVTLRQPLSDALDLMAEEAVESGVTSEEGLRKFLFESDRLKGNRADYYDPKNADLAWCVAEGTSNPLGLCLIYMLVARRLNLEVEGINFPGHFLCRYYDEGYPVIVDCFDRGRRHLQSLLLERGSDLDANQRAHLRQTADPGSILIRMLNNLIPALQQSGREEDAELVERLRGTLG
jgi:regulator of sirC expression with transglutaminase-like and TPR domain